MKNFILISFLINLILGLISFFVTENIFIGGSIFIVSLIFLLTIINKKLINYKKEVNRIHECYLFINNFLITLSIKESLNSAFETVETSVSEEFYDFLKSIDELNPQEKLIYLNKYFPFHVYQIFVDIVNVWVDEGGNILEMSNHIIDEIRQIEEYVSFSQSISRRKIIEASSLWLFSLLVVVVLKISLNSSFSLILKQPVFIISTIFTCILFLATTYLAVNKMTKLEIRRSNDV